MKHNQNGIAHLQLILGLVLVLGVVGFAAYRVGQSNSSDQANQQDTSDVDLAQELKVNEEESKEIDVPQEKEEAKVETEPAKKETAQPEKTTDSHEKKDKTYLKMKSVSAVQDGSVVKIHSQVEQAVSGTCNFKLYRDGYPKTHTSNKISNSQDCIGQLDISSMPNYEGWSLHVWFDGDDGKTYAYQDSINFTLTDPN